MLQGSRSASKTTLKIFPSIPSAFPTERFLAPCLWQFIKAATKLSFWDSYCMVCFIQALTRCLLMITKCDHLTLKDLGICSKRLKWEFSIFQVFLGLSVQGYSENANALVRFISDICKKTVYAECYSHNCSGTQRLRWSSVGISRNTGKMPSISHHVVVVMDVRVCFLPGIYMVQLIGLSGSI